MKAGQLASSSPFPSCSLPRWVKQQCEFAKQAENPDQGPKLDLSFKEGQTIKLNIAVSPPLTWLSRPPHQAQPRAHHSFLTVQHMFIEQLPGARYCAGGERKDSAVIELRVELRWGESGCDYNMAGWFYDLGMSSVP